VILLLFHFAITLPCIGRILLRRHRQPESRIAWLVVILSVPYVGVLAYLLFGETSIGRKRIGRLKRAFERLPRPEQASGWTAPENAAEVPEHRMPLFNVGASISGYAVVGGNSARLMRDSDSAIDEMVADIDAAVDHVHLLFYIWLDDDNGMKMAEALKRAARRGIACRAIIDDLGSREMARSRQWEELLEAGVRTARALRVGNPLWRIFNGRIDLRNHRKILVIDNRISYCGSQNCADPAFLPKARYGPWVDVMMRFEGPVARQNQHLFASDWMESDGEDLSGLLRQPLADPRRGFAAQVIGTGPTARNSAMPEMFENLMYAARRELLVTTPYYVPNAAIQAALCAAANRGVDTAIILPARNDDFAVGAASRSYYEELLTAGVKIHEFQPGLLHAKSITLDGEITLIGSANMDRRSFDLNYENNMLLYDMAITAGMRARQMHYRANSRAITLDEVNAWSMPRRIWNNTLAILGPIL